MNNLCDCAACQLRRAKEKQGLEMAFDIKLTTEEIEEVKRLLSKILNGETNRSLPSSDRIKP